jgi:putative transposase
VTADEKECAKTLVSSGLSILKACLLTEISRASFYRKPKDWRKTNAAVIDAIHQVLKKSPRAGFWKCYGRIRFKKHL